MAWEIGLSELASKKLLGIDTKKKKDTLLYKSEGKPSVEKLASQMKPASQIIAEQTEREDQARTSSQTKGPQKTTSTGSQNSGSQNKKTSSSKTYTSSSKTSTKTSTSSYEKELEKQREMARKAIEQQAGALRGGLKGSYTSSLSALEQLLQGLAPSYQSRREDYERLAREQQQQYEQSLEKNKQADQNRLATLFSSYGTGDSEQRAQVQERMYGEYQRGLQDYLSGLSSQKQTYLSDLDRERAEREMEIAQRRAELQGTYQKGLGEIDAKRFGNVSEVYQSFAQMIQQARQQEEARMAQAQQQDFENRLALQRASGGSGSSNALTSAQQLKVSQDYADDLQKALGRASYMQTGGREQVYNELVNKYGNILDPSSIYGDIFGQGESKGLAYDGWEEQYRQMYKNPATSGDLLESILSRSL